MFDSQVIGDFLIDKEFFIEKKSKKKINALIYFSPENIDSLLFNDDSKNLLIKGYVKTPIFNTKVNFQYDYIFNLKSGLTHFNSKALSFIASWDNAAIVIRKNNYRLIFNEGLKTRSHET